MFTVNYDFEPKDRVFVVIDDTRVEAGAILSVKFQVYENSVPTIVTDLKYLILLDDTGEGTVTLDSSNVFATLAEATNSIRVFLTPTPTVS